MKRFDLTDEVIERNHKLDKEAIQKNHDLTERLREQGVQRKEYDLAPPFGGQRMTVQDDPNRDPRFVRLRRSDQLR